jgi:hypothetical protein
MPPDQAENRLTADEPPDNNTAQDLADAGADLAGALVGGAVGTLGGPIGILGGAALGVAAQRAAKAILGRVSAREEQRAGAVLVMIDAEAQARGERGDTPRSDGFFEAQGKSRPDAETLLEGVLRQAAATYEERKLPYLAYLYDAVSYDATIEPETALFVLHIAERLTYRQLVALAMLCYSEPPETPDVGNGRNAAIEAELVMLHDQGLLGVRVDDDVLPAYRLWNGKGPEQMYGPTDAGAMVAHLMRLDRVPSDEVRDWCAAYYSRSTTRGTNLSEPQRT